MHHHHYYLYEIQITIYTICLFLYAVNIRNLEKIDLKASRLNFEVDIIHGHNLIHCSENKRELELQIKLSTTENFT